MDSPDTAVKEEEVRTNFNEFFKKQSQDNSATYNFFMHLREVGCNCYLFGGAVRDILFDKGKASPRDLDLVFDEKNFYHFESHFKTKIIRRNRFGGLKLKYGGIDIDAWKLDKTWAFSENKVSGISFQNLPKTGFYNLDAIVIQLRPESAAGRNLFDASFFQGINKQVIEIILPDTIYPELNALRGLKLANRTKFKLSKPTAYFIYDTLSKNTCNNLIEIQKDHFGEILFKERTLTEVKNALQHWLEHGWGETVDILPVLSSQLTLPFMEEASMGSFGAAQGLREGKRHKGSNETP